MSDLRDQIKRWDENKLPVRMEILMEAARKYANPDHEAAGRVLWELTYPWGRAWSELRPETRAKYEQQASAVLNAALHFDSPEET